MRDTSPRGAATRTTGTLNYWATGLGTYLKKFHGISTFHEFLFDAADPGTVQARKYSSDDQPWQSFTLWKRGYDDTTVLPGVDAIPTQTAPLMGRKRLEYLKKEVLPFIKIDNRAQFLAEVTAGSVSAPDDSSAGADGEDDGGDRQVAVRTRDGVDLTVDEPPGVPMERRTLQCAAPECLTDPLDRTNITMCDFCPVVMHVECMPLASADPCPDDPDLYWACDACLPTLQLRAITGGLGAVCIRCFRCR